MEKRKTKKEEKELEARRKHLSSVVVAVATQRGTKFAARKPEARFKCYLYPLSGRGGRCDPMRRFVAHCPRPKRTAQGRINIGATRYRACISRRVPRGYSLFLSILVFLEQTLRSQRSRGYSRAELWPPLPPTPTEASLPTTTHRPCANVIGTTVPDLGMDKVGKKVPLSTREIH